MNDMGQITMMLMAGPRSTCAWTSTQRYDKTCACSSQAFCRVAAVAGATYVLRHPVAAVLMDTATGDCVGVRTAAGQTLQCGALAADVATIREVLRQRTDDSENGRSHAAEAVSEACRVARAVCIVDASLQVGL